MSITVHLAFAVWFLVTVGLFSLRPPRRAVVTSFVIGFLFLPNAGYQVTALHRKLDIISVGVLVCSLIFHSRIWLRYRPKLLDLPMVVWCVCPSVSALLNGMSYYDAGSVALENVLKWGIPYFIGRAYFTDIKDLRDLAVGVLIGGVLYVPLCLWEIRMSPQLHLIVYGFFPHESFGQTIRYGGYRPTVFLQHGLHVAIWMAFASLVGFWLWRSGAMKRLWGVPIGWVVLVLVSTTILCKSTNAVVLLALSCLTYSLVQGFRSAVPIACLLLAAPVYIVLRSTGVWSGESLVYYTQQTVNDERAESLGFRIDHETRLLERAFQQRYFGWSGWGRSRIHNREGADLSVTDGMWIINLGMNGLVGLVSWVMAMLLPVLTMLRRCPARLFTHRNTAPAVALSVMLCLSMIDSLFNAMVSPVFSLAAGGLMRLSRQSVMRAVERGRRYPARLRTGYSLPGWRRKRGVPVDRARAARVSGAGGPER